MKPTTRFYIDAFLQNLKNVAFFTYLPVLIAKLGASSFQISLSSSLSPLFCAFSLAFITRQLPLTRNTYYRAGVLRQIAFLCMAFSPLLPHPVVWILFFWAFNSIFVMVTSVQQPALISHAVDATSLPGLFSRLKNIAILVTIVGSFAIGTFLDTHQSMFPYNYMICMVIGAVSTFTGMNIIARLAPSERKPIRFHLVRPLKKCNRLLVAILIANAGITIMNPLWTIYHVNVLHFTNLQIGLFGIISGIISTVLMPFMRRGLERFGSRAVIIFACAVMSVIPLLYVVSASYLYLLLLQVVLGVAFAFYDVAQQTLNVTESKRHADELAFFSDYQLMQNLGNGITPLFIVLFVSRLSMHATFIWLFVLKALSIFVLIVLLTNVRWVRRRPHVERAVVQ